MFVISPLAKALFFVNVLLLSTKESLKRREVFSAEERGSLVGGLVVFSLLFFLFVDVQKRANHWAEDSQVRLRERALSFLDVISVSKSKKFLPCAVSQGALYTVPFGAFRCRPYTSVAPFGPNGRGWEMMSSPVDLLCRTLPSEFREQPAQKSSLYGA